MTSIKTLIAAALVAASSTVAFAEDSNVNRYPAQAGAFAITEGRNAAIAPSGSSEVGVSLYNFGAQGAISVEGRNSAEPFNSGTEVGVERYVR